MRKSKQNHLNALHSTWFQSTVGMNAEGKEGIKNTCSSCFIPREITFRNLIQSTKYLLSPYYGEWEQTSLHSQDYNLLSGEGNRLQGRERERRQRTTMRNQITTWWDNTYTTPCKFKGRRGLVQYSKSNGQRYTAKLDPQSEGK